MKILTTVKRVIDPYVKIRVHPDGSGVETEHVKHVMNPFDEIALEQGIRWLESGLAQEVVVVSIGNELSLEVLRHALALGATRAILVQKPANRLLCSLEIAMILKALILREQPEVVIMGKQAIDEDNNQVPQMLAGLLNWSQGTFASEISATWNSATSSYSFEVVREVDAGHETLCLQGPSIISVDLRLNEPRYASLPGIMKAKQKPIQQITLETLDVILTERVKRVSMSVPPLKKAGIKVDSVQELVRRLRVEEGVL